jgi:dihydrofolate reductase
MMSSTQRKLVYYVASSLDGFIAHRDGAVNGFLSEGRHIPDYLASLHEYATVLMGKATYEWGYQWGVQPGQPSPTYAHMMQYVFSSTMPAYQHPQLQVIREDAADFVGKLKTQAGKAIYLCGGGQLAGYLLAAKQIDELIIKLNPVYFGAGIPLFGSNQEQVALNLLASKTYANGVVFLHYHIRQ